MNFFDYDSPLSVAIRNLVELFVLNICFCLCCVPVVTVGAAVTALYQVFLSKNETGNVIGRFFSALRSNFLKATVIWLIILAVGVLLGASWIAVFTVSFPGRGIFRILLIFCTVLYLSASGFAFALQARYENRLKQTLRNALIFGTIGIIHGALAAAISFFPVVIFFFAIDWMAVVLSVWIPLGGALSCRINAWIYSVVFHQIDKMMVQE